MGVLNIFASSYSQLLRTDSNGNETVLYDVSTAQMTKTVCIFISVLIFVALVTAVIICPFFIAKRKSD